MRTITWLRMGPGAACRAAIFIGRLGSVGGMLLGCGSPSYEYYQLPIPSDAPVSRILPGAGTIIQPGIQAGYGITASLGSTFRIVWTGDAAASGSYRSFTGSIYTLGNFLTLIPGCGGECPLEGGDYISAPLATPGGTRIDFNTVTSIGLDGLDFSVDVEPVYFDLLIDGLRYPSLVFFTETTTQAIASAPAIPFGLTTR